MTPQSTASHVVLTNEVYAEILNKSDAYRAELDEARRSYSKAATEREKARTALATSEAARAQAEKEREVEIAKAVVAERARIYGERDAAHESLKAQLAQAENEAQGHRNVREQAEHLRARAHEEMVQARAQRDAAEARSLAAEAQVMVLREALVEMQKPLPYDPDTGQWWEPGDEELRLALFSEYARRDALVEAALSSPAPSVVRLEEAQSLVEALEKCLSVVWNERNGITKYTDEADEQARTLLSLWKQKQGGGQ